ncbi:MAG: amino acid adenylation protein, partial [Gammaproteobacteria bacterium]|nr:amino acid adenylation protein [Gammaproteobacteria bacterium]
RVITELFEDQVERTPDAVAVIHEEVSLTYLEINTKANQLARYIRELGIGPDKLVGICVERGPEMLIGMLGILKAGGAYLPLDPAYPPERLSYMLADASPEAVLTQEACQSSLPTTRVQIIALDSEWARIAQRDPWNLAAPLGLTDESLLYVIYTSGSTGKPKGTAMAHRSMVNLIEWQRRHFRTESPQRVLQFAALSFDVAFQEVFSTLCAGDTLVLLHEWVRKDIPALMKLLCARSVGRLFLPPLMLKSLAGYWKSTGIAPESLTDVITAGEQLLIDSEVAGFFRHLGSCRLHNHYGPTETHVVTSATFVADPAEWPAVAPIGRPIANSRIYILDEQRKPVPIGVDGEIYIGGVGVARGYLNRPELTAERFLRDPFTDDPNGRLYKTGDVGRWRPDGIIEYRGRNDHQVKVRGFRIELGEIEAQLAQHQTVKETVVIAREDTPGDKRLVAYITEHQPGASSVENLRAFLKERLPEHMIPGAFVVLERLPLTPNGKLDRRALPTPELGAYSSRQYEKPEGEIEELLAGVWQDLLHVDLIGRQDNFFELGGHSLLIVQMMERLRRVGLSAEIRRVFENPTLQDLAREFSRTACDEIEVPPNGIPRGCDSITPLMLPLLELQAEHIQRIAQAVPGGCANIQDIYPLLPLQEGILFHHLLDPEDADLYARPILLSLRSRNHVEKLITALQTAIARHDILRTAVLWEHLPRPVQVVYRTVTLPVEEIALDRDRDAREQLRERMREEGQKLDLRRAPLLRLEISPDPQDGLWYALLRTHHLVTDNESLNILLSEVVAHLEGRQRELPAPVPYRNHVAQALAYARTHDAQAFFRSKLGDVEEPTAPFGLLELHGAGGQVDQVRQALEPALARRVRTQARRLGLSAATLFHAAWGLVVAHTSGRDDVVFGSVLLGRLQGSAGSQRTLGMFINTLPLRLRLETVSAKDLVEYTQRELVELLGHEHASLVEAQRCSAVSGSMPLFSTLLNYVHGSSNRALMGSGAAGLALLAFEGRTNYPILLTVEDQGEAFELVLETDRRIDSGRLLGYVSTALRSLSEALDEDPQAPALALSILPDTERRRVLETFNPSYAPALQTRLIHQLFEEQAQRTPEAVAVVCEGGSLTYGALNAKANQLARHLRELGVGPDQRVAICVERSLEMVVGLLGILKAGGAYLPLDPGYPPERLVYMLHDAAPGVLLTQEHLKERVPDSGATVVALDRDWSRIAQQDANNLEADTVGLKTSHLAYVIYTSGSTGNPKGVMVEHRNVTRLFAATQHWFEFNERDVWTLFHSFAFDFSVWELWGALFYGGRVIIVPYLTSRSPQDFYRLVCEEGVTVLNQTPSAFAQLIDAQTHSARKEHALRTVIFGGEALELRTLRPWVQQNGAQQPVLVNMYGITETTVHVTYRPLTRQEIESERGSPVGEPIPDLRVYLLDRRRQPVPIGVPGELYVGGAGVARGYLNRPDLSAERFIKDPFSAAPEARLYKTGDLGRWRADGVIEYLGRNDQQVKIRGFRIELGEIEAQLARHPQVREAVVLARNDAPGEKRLVAYLIARESSGTASGIEELRAHLKAVLPEHMIPSAFVVLQSFPLTSNGKLDRRALPAPDSGDYVSRRYQAPEGEIEEILSGIWQSLLGVERVGRQDNFFELGGHSLLIVQMLERLRRVGLSTQVRRVFDCPTLTELAGALVRGAVGQFEVPPNRIPSGCDAITPAMLPLVELETEHLERITRAVPGGAANIQDIYPLAPLQEGILFHHLLNQQGGDIYARPMLLSLPSKENVRELITALEAVIQRHDVLRTAVLWEQLPRAVQVVLRKVTLPVQEVSLDPGRDPIEQLEERMRPERQRLDLRNAPLIQLQIASDGRGEQWYALLLTHHLVMDNESLDILLSELTTYLHCGAAQLPEPVPYRNHVAQALAHAKANDAEAFFRNKLADVDEPTAPFGLLEVHGDGSLVEEAHAELDAELARSLRIQARRLGLSTATIFHAAWALVLSRTTARDDVVFGSVLLGRLQGTAGAQRILGMFINTLPLRLKLADATAKELVEGTQRELVELLGHEQASLAVAQRCSGVAGSSPLFSTLLNYRHRPPETAMRRSATPGVTLLASQGRTNYPILLSVDDRGDGFELTLETDRRIDPQRLMGFVSTALRSLVEALDRAPETPALALPILSEAERRQVVEVFNATRRPYPADKLVHQLFEEQVERTPDATAVVYEDDSLTYAELNARANQLAHYLRDRQMGPDRLVGVCLERSLEMVVGLLGVLKSGGAYVPLDPSYPLERLTYMLEDAAPQVLLTQAHLRAKLPATPTEVIALDADWPQIASQSLGNPDTNALCLLPEHLAYVIYTSGSTGRPKGAMNEHRGVVNRLQWMQDQYRLGTQDRVLQKTPFSFDVSVWEFFWTLMSGARLVIARPEGHKDPGYLRKVIEKSGATTLHFVPSMLQLFLDQLQPGECASLRHVVCSGEELSGALRSKCFEHLPQVRLSNLYGPTEAAVDVTVWECRRDETGPRVPIGHPISNIRMYVLDGHRRPLPFGVPGELFIAGVGVGRGYLNRAELTAERFVRDPFSPDPNARMYRTGDLGLWRADGNIEYLGRNDHQVKIRGLRIELGEIETRLRQHAQVREAVVIAREDIPGEKRLVAYVVPRIMTGSDGTPPRVESLRSHLKIGLPDYMVPAAFVMLEQLPLSANGKLDRRALPVPELGAHASRRYEAPQGEVEDVLVGIWQDLLRVERVGRQDNFFELGGHSLLIVQMLERLRRVGLSAEIRRVFASPTLADLASALTRDAVGQFEVPPNRIPAGCKAITPSMLPLITLEPGQIERLMQSVRGGAENVQDIYPLTPLQEGILFHHLLDEQGPDIYVLPTLLSVSSRERVEELIAAIQAVIDRHDVLRTAVLWEQLPRPVQVVHRQAVLSVEQFVLDRNRDPVEQVKEWLRPEWQQLDLRHAPLMRLQIASDPHSERWYALIQLHHIISDHVTAEAVIAEVVAHMEGRAEGLPELVPYRNHVAQTLAWSKDHDEAFFRGKLADIDEPTAPFGLLDIHGDGGRVEEAHEELEPELALRVRGQARRSGVSVATLFHAAWALVLASTTGRDDVVLGSVLLGRLGSVGGQRILGMFINTLPLRLKLKGTSARELVEQTQRELVELVSHEQASLAAAQRCSGIAGSAPLFSALLNYRHSAPAPEAQWSGADGIRVLATQERTNYPIAVSVDDLGERLTLKAQTDERIDPRRMTAYLHTAVRSLVDALEQAPRTSALSLSVLPAGERHQVLESFNATQGPYPHDKLIHEVFEQQVELAPNATALVYEGRSLTYRELNDRANQVAGYLRKQGVGPNQLVGLCLDRGLEIVVGLLGILKAGGAYVPLDPEYPVERLAYMVGDAAPKVLLTQARMREHLPALTAKVVAVDADAEAIAQEPTANLDAGTLDQRPDQLAYVIYTSGSTGQPKGVMIEHGTVMNFWRGLELACDRSNRCQRVALNSSFNFDASLQHLMGLLSGRTLFVVPQTCRWDAAALLGFLNENRIQSIDCTPSQLKSWLSVGLLEQCASDDLLVLVGGEEVDPELWNTLARSPAITFYNAYGPTEITVQATMTRVNQDRSRPHIGPPMLNRRIYILDPYGQPVPVGCVGEIHIGGTGVGRGYLNNPQLTAQRFLRDPFVADPQARMYKTGDLGRWRADGAIEFLGRNDQQVKIRGFRIELGEIESQLGQHELVREAIVVAREDVPGDKRLVAYVVPESTAGAPPRVNIESLRVHLQTVLPEYMVPSAFVVLERLPIAPNGKLDRRSLPAPDSDAYVSGRYEAPRGKVEQILADIWRDVLRVDRVGRQDNFFAMGGHSLLAMRVTARVRQLLGAQATPRLLFSAPSLEGYAKSIETLTWLKNVALSGSAASEEASSEGVI